MSHWAQLTWSLDFHQLEGREQFSACASLRHPSQEFYPNRAHGSCRGSCPRGTYDMIIHSRDGMKYHPNLELDGALRFCFFYFSLSLHTTHLPGPGSPSMAHPCTQSTGERCSDAAAAGPCSEPRPAAAGAAAAGDCCCLQMQMKNMKKPSCQANTSTRLHRSPPASIGLQKRAEETCRVGCWYR